MMKKNVVMMLLMVAAMSMAACGSKETKETATVETTVAESVAVVETTVEQETETGIASDVEEGVKSITMEVLAADGTATTYEFDTEALYLMDALQDVEGFTFDGSAEEWGYNLTTINDSFADYDADGAYWAVYINGNYGEFSIDSQPIHNGDQIVFEYTVFNMGGDAVVETEAIDETVAETETAAVTE